MKKNPNGCVKINKTKNVDIEKHKLNETTHKKTMILFIQKNLQNSN